MSFDTSRRLLPSWSAPFVCLLLTVPVVLVIVVNVGVGLHYHPDKKAAYLAVSLATAALVLALLLLIIVRWRSGRLVQVTKFLAWLIGGGLSVFGAYALFVDAGDWVLWIWPFLLGLSVLWMAKG